MSGQALRTRKNGTLELRFRFNGKTVSVYGKTQEECMNNKRMKLLELYGSAAQPANEETVFCSCLRYCEKALNSGTVHKERYKSLLRTARFIGRSRFGPIPIDELDDGMIGLFRTESSGYSDHTVQKAIYMLIKIRGG